MRGVIPIGSVVKNYILPNFGQSKKARILFLPTHIMFMTHYMYEYILRDFWVSINLFPALLGPSFISAVEYMGLLLPQGMVEMRH